MCVFVNTTQMNQIASVVLIIPCKTSIKEHSSDLKWTFLKAYYAWCLCYFGYRSKRHNCSMHTYIIKCHDVILKDNGIILYLYLYIYILFNNYCIKLQFQNIMIIMQFIMIIIDVLSVSINLIMSLFVTHNCHINTNCQKL